MARQATSGNSQLQSSRLGFSAVTPNQRPATVRTDFTALPQSFSASHLLPPRYQLNQDQHLTPQGPSHGTPDYQSSTYALPHNALPPQNQFYHYQAPSAQQPRHGRFVQIPDAQLQATQLAPQIPHDNPQCPQLPVPVPRSTATSISTRAQRRTGKAWSATKLRQENASLPSKPLATAQWPPPYTPFSDLPQALQMHYWSMSLKKKRPVEDIVEEEYAKTILRGPPQSVAAYFSSESATDESDSDTTSAQWQAGQKRVRILSGGLHREAQQMKRTRTNNYVPSPGPALSQESVNTEGKASELEFNSDIVAPPVEPTSVVEPTSEPNPMAELFAMIEAVIKLKTPEELAEDMKEHPLLPEHEYIRDAVYSFFP